MVPYLIEICYFFRGTIFTFDNCMIDNKSGAKKIMKKIIQLIILLSLLNMFFCLPAEKSHKYLNTDEIKEDKTNCKKCGIENHRRSQKYIKSIIDCENKNLVTA